MKRNVEAILHRGYRKTKRVIWVRRYVRLRTAATRAMRLMLEAGYPGDVVEFSDQQGRLLGTVTLHVKGRLEMEWKPGMAPELI